MDWIICRALKSNSLTSAKIFEAVSIESFKLVLLLGTEKKSSGSHLPGIGFSSTGPTVRLSKINYGVYLRK